MAESNFTKVAIVAGAAGVGYFLFRNQLHHAYPSIFGPGISTDVLTADAQSALITKGRTAGMTDQQTQTALEQIGTQATQCAAQGGTWSPATGQCTTTQTNQPQPAASQQPPPSSSSSGSGTTTTPPPTPPPSQPNGVRARILAAAGVTSASADVWSYFYQQVTGSTISAQQMGAIVSAAGETRDSSGNLPVITLDAFVAAGMAAGVIPSNLSGIRRAGRKAWRY